MGASSPAGRNSRTAEFGDGKPSHLADGAGGIETSGHSQTLSILVFKGQPVDIQSTRLAEFYIVTNDVHSTNTTFRLEGHVGVFWVSETSSLEAPRSRDNFQQQFHVATIHVNSATDTSVRDVIMGTPIKNEPDWNRLNWVEEVVLGLQRAGLVADGEGTPAVNATIDEFVRDPLR